MSVLKPEIKSDYKTLDFGGVPERRVAVRTGVHTQHAVSDKETRLGSVCVLLVVVVLPINILCGRFGFWSEHHWLRRTRVLSAHHYGLLSDTPADGNVEPKEIMATQSHRSRIYRLRIFWVLT